MTEPNRDTTNEPDDRRPRRIVFPKSTIPHPGVFERDCRVPEPPASLALWDALRHAVDEHLGVRWVIDLSAARRFVLRKVDEDLRFDLEVDLTRSDCPYATLVRHHVADLALADRIETILLEFPRELRASVPLKIGYGHDIDPRSPESLANFQLSILTRWNPAPTRPQEHRIAQYLLWNVDVLLWLRAQAAALHG